MRLFTLLTLFALALVSTAAAQTVRVLGRNSIAPIYCTSTAYLDMTSNTTTQVVALSGTTVIYVCSYAIVTNGTTTVKLVGGTGSNCASSQAQLTPNYDFTTQTGINRVAGAGNIVTKTAAGAALCVTNGQAVNAHIEISFAQF